MPNIIVLYCNEISLEHDDYYRLVEIVEPIEVTDEECYLLQTNRYHPSLRHPIYGAPFIAVIPEKKEFKLSIDNTIIAIKKELDKQKAAIENRKKKEEATRLKRKQKQLERLQKELANNLPNKGKYAEPGPEQQS